MFYKILHNVDHPLQCKLPQFTKPIRITQHATQKNDKTFVLAGYNTYQFSRCFTYYTTRLWNILPNEAALTEKQDCFIVLAKKFLCDQ